jgi:SAM-dependent methyltransferase
MRFPSGRGGVKKRHGNGFPMRRKEEMGKGSLRAGNARVLDLGCGIGEVSLIAARLVGRGGCVIDVDVDEKAGLETVEKPLPKPHSTAEISSFEAVGVRNCKQSVLVPCSKDRNSGSGGPRPGEVI